MSAALEPPTSPPPYTLSYLRWWSQISALLLVVVELCWILPWFKLLTQITQTAPLWVAGLVLAAVMLASYGVGRGLAELHLRKNFQLVILLGLLIVSLLAAENWLLDQPVRNIPGGLIALNPGAILVLFFVVWLWWRGLTLSRFDIRPMVAWKRFELGLLFIMAYLYIATRTHFPVPGLGVSILFLFSGLLAVVFARVSYVGLSKGVEKNPFDLRWSLSVVGILGATVLLAAIAGGLVSGQYHLLLDFLSSLLKMLVAVVIFILGLPGLLVSVVIAPLFPWLSGFFKPRPHSTPEEYPQPNLAPLFSDQTQAINLSEAFQTVCFWGLVIVVIAILIIRVRRTLMGRRTPEPAEPESLLKQGEAARLMRKALQEALAGLGAALRPVRRTIAAARIRRIYIQLMELCAALGLPRLPHQTPQEFLPVMGELFSAQIDDLSLLTQAYERVRYGELPENPTELETIEQAWLRLQLEGRRLKKSSAGRLQTASTEEIERRGV